MVRQIAARIRRRRVKLKALKGQFVGVGHAELNEG
jgi:hypothetical protein